jgi:phage-related protein
LGEPLEDPTIRTTFESGIVQTRAKFTRMRGTWALTWANLRGEHYRTLRAFYKQMKGGAFSFNWTHPQEKVSYDVRFSGQFSPHHTVRDCWSLTVTLEQV